MPRPMNNTLQKTPRCQGLEKDKIKSPCHIANYDRGCNRALPGCGYNPLLTEVDYVYIIP
nr:MAG TPA: hypothetical protein [Caudoviricetes sp.]